MSHGVLVPDLILEWDRPVPEHEIENETARSDRIAPHRTSTVGVDCVKRRTRECVRECGTSVILHSPRKATENKEQITKAACRVFAYHSNAYALSTLTRTLPQAF